MQNSRLFIQTIAATRACKLKLHDPRPLRAFAVLICVGRERVMERLRKV